MRTFTALTRPVASATPDGDCKVVRPYRWIPEWELAEIELAEARHLESQKDRVEARYDEAEIRWQNQLQRLANAADADDLEAGPRLLSSRQAVIAEIGELERRNNRGYSLKSRSHCRAKASRLPDRRTIRQLPLAA